MHEKILLTKAISNKIALARLYKSDTTGLDMIKIIGQKFTPTNPSPVTGQRESKRRAQA
jgi:hypothetical protein